MKSNMFDKIPVRPACQDGQTEHENTLHVRFHMTF